ncbi:MAG: glycosyltransferase family 2 protein [Chlamydiae bacterium]|nr:glycosyltransferase family 2 protein [Chlamydiota bacterium]
MKVYLIVLNYRGKEDTKECILSILDSSYKNFEIVIVDNHSQDQSISYLREAFPGITLLETEKNLGYAGGNNVGIQFALDQGAEAILILNNDTTLDKDCIKNFVAESKTYPNSILGGRVYYFDTPSEMQHFGGVWSHRKGKFINQPDRDFDTKRARNLDFITGCALFVPRQIFHKTGLFEESFFLYYEEIDWCFRARKLGFFCTYVPSPMIFHKESKSFATPKPPQSYFQWRNRIFFIERNFEKSQFYLWLFTKFPKRLFLLFIKRWIKELDILFLGNSEEKQISKLSYKASLKGISDYFKRSFGNGPSWIFKKVERTS